MFLLLSTSTFLTDPSSQPITQTSDHPYLYAVRPPPNYLVITASDLGEYTPGEVSTTGDNKTCGLLRRSALYHSSGNAHDFDTSLLVAMALRRHLSP